MISEAGRMKLGMISASARVACHSERSEESLIIWTASAMSDSQRCFAPLNMTAEKSVVIARITAHCEVFCEIFYSRIDNTRLNFRLSTPGSASG